MYPAANTNIQILIYFSCFIIYCFLENFNYFKGWNFFEVDFWSRDFWGVSIGSPRDFFGFWFLPSFDHPCRLKSVVSWVCYTASKFFLSFCGQLVYYGHFDLSMWNGHTLIGRDLDLQHLSKVRWQSVASLDSGLDSQNSIPAQMENQVKDRVPQDRKQKMHPPLIS